MESIKSLTQEQIEDVEAIVAGIIMRSNLATKCCTSGEIYGIYPEITDKGIIYKKERDIQINQQREDAYNARKYEFIGLGEVYRINSFYDLRFYSDYRFGKVYNLECIYNENRTKEELEYIESKSKNFIEIYDVFADVGDGYINGEIQSKKVHIGYVNHKF